MKTSIGIDPARMFFWWDYIITGPMNTYITGSRYDEY